MNQFWTKIEEIRQRVVGLESILSLENASDSSGVCCSYFQINDKVGLKIFRCKSDYERSVQLHLLVLNKHKVAPLIFGSITIQHPKYGYFHCLLVEHVRIFSKFRRELSDDERKLYREIKAQFEDSMWELQKTEYAEDDFFRRLIVDLHDSNVGFRGTQPLMIDFSIP